MKLIARISTALALILAAGAAYASPIQLQDGVATVDANAIQAQIQAVQSGVKGSALQFAVPVDSNLSIDDAKMSVSGLISKWSMDIVAPGAYSVSLLLSDVSLPQGAEIWLEDVAGGVRQGPYTSDSIKQGNKIWTAVVPGSRARLIATMPITSHDKPIAFRVTQIFYGALDIWKDPATPTSYNKASGTCEVDVACSAGNAWTSEARSVARIIISGTSLCSGQLLNSSGQNLTPYFLTAAHCNIKDQPAASSVVVYWLYQRTACGSGSADLTKNQSGSTLLMTHPGNASGTIQNADHTLIALDNIPAGSSNVYYAGWDASGAAPGNGAGMHHPGGDVKKISIPGTVQPINNGVYTAWNVKWASGITEPGSSGSALFDANHRVVGVLSNGGSTCSNTTATDNYGRFSDEWEGSTTDLSLQLRNHLDTATTCGKVLNGRDNSAGAGSSGGSTCPDGGAQLPVGSLSASASSVAVGASVNFTVGVTNNSASSRVNQILFNLPNSNNSAFSSATINDAAICGSGQPIPQSDGSIAFKYYSVKAGSTCNFTATTTAKYAGTYTVSMPAGSIKSGVGGNQQALSKSVTVNPTTTPDTGFTISATAPKAGAPTSSTISWEVPQGTTCTASGDWSGAQPNHGSFTAVMTETRDYTYTLACSNSFGNATKSVVVNSAAASSSSASAAPVSGGGSKGGAFGLLTLLPMLLTALIRRKS